MSELAVQGCTVTATSESGTVSALMSLSLSSQDILVSNKGVYFDKITVTLLSGTTVTTSAGTGTLVAPTPIDINGTASNILESGKKAVQKNDSGNNSSVNFMFPYSTSPVPIPIKVEVTDAGQTDVIAL